MTRQSVTGALAFGCLALSLVALPLAKARSGQGPDSSSATAVRQDPRDLYLDETLDVGDQSELSRFGIHKTPLLPAATTVAWSEKFVSTLSSSMETPEDFGGAANVHIYWPDGGEPHPVVIYYQHASNNIANKSGNEAAREDANKDARQLARTFNAIVLAIHSNDSQPALRTVDLRNREDFKLYDWAVANATSLGSAPDLVVLAAETDGVRSARSDASHRHLAGATLPIPHVLIHRAQGVQGAAPVETDRPQKLPLATTPGSIPATDSLLQPIKLFNGQSVHTGQRSEP